MRSRSARVATTSSALPAQRTTVSSPKHSGLTGGGKQLCIPLGNILGAESMLPFGIRFGRFRARFDPPVYIPFGYGMLPFGIRDSVFFDRRIACLPSARRHG